MSLEATNNDWFLVVEKDSLTVNKISLDGTKKTGSWLNTDYVGGYVLSNGKIIVFSFYYNVLKERFDYSIVDPNNISNISWTTISNNPSGKQLGYYQAIELDNFKLITCYLSENKDIVGCFSGVYNSNNNSFSLSRIMTDIIVGCNVYDYFYLYKLGENFGVVGCGIDSLKIAKINYDLIIIGELIEINNSDIHTITFSTFGNNVLYFLMSKKSDGYYHYYISQFYFPNCASVKFIIPSTEYFNLENLFISSKETVHTQDIIITSNINNGIIYDSNDTEIMLNTTYKAKELKYKALQSSFEIFTFKGADFTSFPPKIWESEECTVTLVICFDTCKSCLTPGTLSNHKCLSCDNVSYFRKENDDNNCYNFSLLDEGYYFDHDNLKFKKCHTSCKTCLGFGTDSNTNCSKCDINNNYYPIYENESLCKLYEANLEGWVLENNYFHKCYETCKTCSKTKDNKNDGCDTCKEGYMMSPIIPKTCVQTCDTSKSTWYYGINYEFFCLNSTECIGEYPFLIPQTNQCVSTCKDLYTCQYCIENQPLYEYNDQCVRECPNGIDIGIKCKQIKQEQEKPTITDSSIEYESKTSKEEFINMKDQAIDLALDEQNGKNITIIKGKDYSVDIYSTNIDSEITKSKGLPKINLGECEALLRKGYNIPEEEELYICQMVYDTVSTTSATNPIEYEVYSQNKTKLDLSICDNVTIKITQGLQNTDNLNLELAKQLAEEGIDIYNSSSPIFNDHCSTFSLDGKDLTLKDRRNDIFTNVSFCSEGCSLSTLNLTTNEVECECEPKKNGINSILEENEIFSMFNTLLTKTNIELFTCAKLTLTAKNFIKNAGSWIMIINICSLIGFILIFSLQQIHALYLSIAAEIKFSPPSIHVQEMVESPPLSSENELDIKIYKKNCSKQMISFTKDEKDSSRSFSDEEESYLDEELNEMEFIDAIDKDQRSFISYYVSIISEKEIFLATILNKSIFYPISLRLIMLFFTISSFFFLNAMFFTEDYISARYHSSENLNIWYILKNEISKSVYASLLGMLIEKIIGLLISSNSEYIKIKKMKRTMDCFVELAHFLIEVKKKYIITLVIISIITIVYWYYLFIFCSVYHSNQISWIQSSLISIVINSIFPILVCLVIGVLRKLSFKLNNKLIFKISFCLYQII